MDWDSYYFIGIGGIGMSNLARYFLAKTKKVGGYDRIETPLTQALVKEGALIHYIDDIEAIPDFFSDKERTLVVYTPAVGESHSELSHFRSEGYRVVKRAELLGEITRSSEAVCVAGTHGKTTLSGMIAHILHQSHIGCNAFLGGILKNYGTNLLLSENSNITVAEADEYDRSFHRLSPFIAVVTSADADHLDIYGSRESYRESFEKFISLIRPGGDLILKKDLELTPSVAEGVKVWSYSESQGDFHAENIRIEDGKIIFDFVSPTGIIADISLAVPIKINVENGVAAIAAAQLCGVTPEEIRSAMSIFSGITRRFDFRIRDKKILFIDDYAHHPNELRAAIESIKELYFDKKITALFQPHLYSRTADFSDDFAESLSLLDDVILLDIYPAREEPIEGVTSQIILDKISSREKQICKKSDLLALLAKKPLEVLVTFGAGDIDQLVPLIESMLRDRFGLDDR